MGISSETRNKEWPNEWMAIFERWYYRKRRLNNEWMNEWMITWMLYNFNTLFHFLSHSLKGWNDDNEIMKTISQGGKGRGRRKPRQAKQQQHPSHKKWGGTKQIRYYIVGQLACMMPAAVAGSPPGIVTASNRSDAAAACVHGQRNKTCNASQRKPCSTSYRIVSDHTISYHIVGIAAINRLAAKYMLTVSYVRYGKNIHTGGPIDENTREKRYVRKNHKRCAYIQQYWWSNFPCLCWSWHYRCWCSHQFSVEAWSTRGHNPRCTYTSYRVSCYHRRKNKLQITSICRRPYCRYEYCIHKVVSSCTREYMAWYHTSPIMEHTTRYIYMVLHYRGALSWLHHIAPLARRSRRLDVHAYGWC